MKTRAKAKFTRSERHDGRSRSGALRVLDDFGLLALHDGDAGVGGAQVDADDGAGGLAIAAVAKAAARAEEPVLVGD
jgi:hypothetical protein